MYKLLIDTCVWLDLAKDSEQQSILKIIEDLVETKQIELIVPRTIIEEFNRNKNRIAEESGKSLSSVFKRVKDAVNKFGEENQKKVVLDHLSNVDYKIPSLGHLTNESLILVEQLLNKSTIVEVTDQILISASKRGVEKKAPFHKGKNSINDAIIIETYAACIQNSLAGTRFAFITHNTKDFSSPNESDRLPHPDIATIFSKIKSKYYIKVSEVLQRINPDLITDRMIEEEISEEARTLTDILEAEGEFTEKLWYNRHQIWLEKIADGRHKIVRRTKGMKYNPNETPKDIFDGARRAAKRVEKKYGLANLGPWDDFEWGMINGKVSALRWVIGLEWDSLDT